MNPGRNETAKNIKKLEHLRWKVEFGKDNRTVMHPGMFKARLVQLMAQPAPPASCDPLFQRTTCVLENQTTPQTIPRLNRQRRQLIADGTPSPVPERQAFHRTVAFSTNAFLNQEPGLHIFSRIKFQYEQKSVV